MPSPRYENHRQRIRGPRGAVVPGVRRLPRNTSLGRFSTRVPHAPSGGSFPLTSSQFSEAHRQQVRDRLGQFAGGWGVGWIGLEQIAENMFQWEEGVKRSVLEAAEQLKDEMVAYMKENAPWEDDPTNDTNARESLQGVVIPEANGNVSIWLAHGEEIYYGIWLEVRWGGRYAIILPTIQKFAPEFGNRIRTRA